VTSSHSVTRWQSLQTLPLGVVLAVAGDALVRRFLCDLAAFVARLAGDAAMATAESKAAAREVIERRLLPIARGVALLTLGAVVAFVAVVLGVAAEAGIRRFLIHLVDVTTHTRDLGVLARQCVFAGDLVIEVRVGPSGFRMAIGASRAEIAAVNVVVHVTRVALGLGGVVRLVRFDVATDAHGFHVLAEQREVAQVVVELVGIKAENVVVATFVLGVARGALRSGDRLLFAVEAAARSYIVRDVLVAREAERLLLIARKGRVARRAHCFRFSMDGRYWARHHEPFE
jgi:hypothetical protein